MTVLTAERLTALLEHWLPTQRWFRSRGEITSLVPLQTTTWVRLGDGYPRLDQVLLEVTQLGVEQDETVETYQLLLGVRETVAEHLDHAHIGVLDTGEGLLWVYDALHDHELTAEILTCLTRGAQVGPVTFRREPGARLDAARPSRPLLQDQSNSSLLYGDDFILKLFRRLEPGVNPDLELHRLLHRHHSPFIADPYASIEGELRGEPVTLGLLQQYYANSADGWAMATASVRDLLTEADLHADEVGGDFAAEAERLGQAVAAVHSTLASAAGSHDLRGDELSAFAFRLHTRLDASLAAAPELWEYEKPIREVFYQLEGAAETIRVQRIHGDLHLGQVLRTVTRWVLIDFEGEPHRSLEERTAPASPLQDVAGMLRSFDYAAHHLTVDRGDEPQLEYRALEWADRNKTAFCRGYASLSGVDPTAEPVTLRALELDKAAYEVAYEAQHRPQWRMIPLRAIARLVEKAGP